jgi:hypothetical protein
MVSAYPSLPPTSAAVNIQIVEPKNFAGGATAGSLGPGGPQSYQPHNGAQYPGQYPGQAPQGQYPGQYGNPNAGGYVNPQQQIYNAYNDAQKARNNYLDLANRLNNEAYWQQQQQQPQYQVPFGTYGQQPMNQSINYGAPQQQQQWPQYSQFPAYNQVQWQQPQQWPQPQQQWPQPQPIEPQNVPQPQPQQVQLPEPPKPEEAPKPVPPQEPVNPLKTAGVDDLNMMVANPATLQEKVNAMEEIGVRGQGNPQTYDLLKKEALSDTSQLTGQSLDDANYVRQAALWTLGMLNKSQNSGVPTDKLPGIAAIERIIGNKKENVDVQEAAVQALQVIDRPKDKRIVKILKQAAKSKNPDLKRLANDALAGKTIPLPTQQPNMMMFA